MNTQRIVIGLAWVVTVIGAYFVGGSGASPELSRSSSKGENSSSEVAAAGRERRDIVQKPDGTEEDPGRKEKANIPLLVARARVEMASGMGGMMNMRGMFRAIAPILELDDAQVQEALAEVERSIKEPQQKMMLYSLLLSQWAEKDGKAALEYADKNLKSSPMFDMGVKSGILGAWARTDPDGAWRWYETEGKKSGNDRTASMALHALFAGLANRDLPGAIARLDTLDETDRQMALSGIANSGADENSRMRLLELSASQPEKTRDALRQQALSRWAMMEPDAALAWLRKLPADEQKPLRQSISQSMMMMNPKQGAEAMLEDASDEEKPRIYDQAIGQWAHQDPKAAAQWLLDQPQTPALDSARMTFARSVVGKEPATAMDWAKSVTKPESRESSVSQIYQMWKQRDAKAADAALDASGLPAEAIDRARGSAAASKSGGGQLYLQVPPVVVPR